MSSQLLLFPARPALASTPKLDGNGRCAQVLTLPTPSARLRRCVIDSPGEGKAGRMVLSGRISDVCAALDQMMANG